MILKGYASIFGNTDMLHDIVCKGAFKNTLKELIRSKNSIPVYFNHNYNNLIGYIKYNNLKEDRIGLKVKINIIKKDLILPYLEYNIKLGLSIGYDKKNVEYTSINRKLNTVELKEISIVIEPANTLCRLTSWNYIKDNKYIVGGIQ